MSTNYPAALDTLTNPSPTDGLTGHAQQHADANDAIEALQAKVGITGSTDAASLEYRVTAAENGKVDKVSGKQLSAEDYTTAEKSKLAGIEAGANAYTHPVSHAATMIVEDSTHRFVTDAQTAAWVNMGRMQTGNTWTVTKNTDGSWRGFDYMNAKAGDSLAVDAIILELE